MTTLNECLTISILNMTKSWNSCGKIIRSFYILPIYKINSWIFIDKEHAEFLPHKIRKKDHGFSSKTIHDLKSQTNSRSVWSGRMSENDWNSKVIVVLSIFLARHLPPLKIITIANISGWEDSPATKGELRRRCQCRWDPFFTIIVIIIEADCTVGENLTI